MKCNKSLSSHQYGVKLHVARALADFSYRDLKGVPVRGNVLKYLLLVEKYAKQGFSLLIKFCLHVMDPQNNADAV